MKDETVDPECIADLEAQKDYLGPLNLLLYINIETFD